MTQRGPHLSARVSVFQTRSNQAIRIPKAMSFPGATELEARREGDILTLRPVRPSWESFFALDPLAFWPPGPMFSNPARLTLEMATNDPIHAGYEHLLIPDAPPSPGGPQLDATGQSWRSPGNHGYHLQLAAPWRVGAKGLPQASQDG